ncbi:MAG: hypothetical protein SPF70_05790, partial [Lachnospiraceae bacterium]|nr:hypothetical protein [Lachnospiraceae bacterium]
VSQLVNLTKGDSMTYEDSISADRNGEKIYCVTKVFHLKTEQGATDSTFDVFLSKGVNGENGTVSTNGYVSSNDTSDLSGTYVVCTRKENNLTSEGNTGLYASNAIRFYFNNTSLSNENGKDSVFCPNSDVSDTSGHGANKVSGLDLAITADIKQKTSGEFESTAASDKTYSTSVFKINGHGVDNKIEMKVWIEGDDPQCVNEVALDELLAQIQFTLAE